MNRIIFILLFFITSCATNVRWAKFNNLDYFNIKTFETAIDNNYNRLCNVNFPESKNKKTLTIIYNDFYQAALDNYKRDDLHWSFRANLYRIQKGSALYFQCNFFESIFSRIDIIKIPIQWNIDDNDKYSFAYWNHDSFPFLPQDFTTDYLLYIKNFDNPDSSTISKSRTTLYNVKNGKQEILYKEHYDPFTILEKDKNIFLRQNEYFKDSITLLE